MATMMLYTVYDRVAEEAGPCFLAVNDGVAVRQYRRLVEESQVVTQEEYQLFRVGSYDSKSMEIHAEDPVRILVSAVLDDATRPRLFD